MSHNPVVFLLRLAGHEVKGQPRQLSNVGFYSPPYIALAEALLCLVFKGCHCMVAHGAYLGHVI